MKSAILVVLFASGLSAQAVPFYWVSVLPPTTISGTLNFVVTGPRLTSACEDGLRTSGGTTDQGGLYPDTYTLTSCENMTTSPLAITTVRCRSNVPGQTGDVQARDVTGTYHSVLYSPIACTSQGVEAAAKPGAFELPGDPLQFVVGVTVNWPALPLPKWVLVDAVRSQ